MGTYEELFTSVVFASWVFYALAAAGVIVLRRKHPEWKRPYLCWGYPWVPIVFVIAAIALIANTFAADVRSSVIGTVLMSSGLPAYWFWNRRRKHAPEAVR
jgi:APA family basic amino acid/polyamine antiporter